MTSVAKTCILEESKQCNPIVQQFSQVLIVFMVNSAKGATKMFAVDVHERQKVQALTRRRIEGAVSDQSLLFMSLLQAGFRRRGMSVKFMDTLPTTRKQEQLQTFWYLLYVWPIIMLICF